MGLPWQCLFPLRVFGIVPLIWAHFVAWRLLVALIVTSILHPLEWRWGAGEVIFLAGSSLFLTFPL
jgi:hypothetical protein